MFSTEEKDILSLEYAATYYNLLHLLQNGMERGTTVHIGNKVLSEIKNLAIRTVGKAAFEAALEVYPKNN